MKKNATRQSKKKKSIAIDGVKYRIPEDIWKMPNGLWVPKGYFSYPRALCWLSPNIGLRPRARAMLLALMCYGEADIYARVDTLARYAGLSKNTGHRALKDLRRLGIIVWTSWGSEKGTNLYKFVPMHKWHIWRRIEEAGEKPKNWTTEWWMTKNGDSTRPKIGNDLSQNLGRIYTNIKDIIFKDITKKEKETFLKNHSDFSKIESFLETTEGKTLKEKTLGSLRDRSKRYFQDIPAATCAAQASCGDLAVDAAIYLLLRYPFTDASGEENEGGENLRLGLIEKIGKLGKKKRTRKKPSPKIDSIKINFSEMKDVVEMYCKNDLFKGVFDTKTELKDRLLASFGVSDE